MPGAVGAIKRIKGKASADILPDPSLSSIDSSQSSYHYESEVIGLERSISSDHQQFKRTRSAQLASKLEDSLFFKAVINTTIIVNTITLSLSIELTTGSWNILWDVLDHVFTIVFFLEMVLKLIHLRQRYFCDNWNIMDFVLVVIGVLDSWVFGLLSVSSSVLPKANLLRILRLMRLVRILKVLRVRRELELLVAGILAAVKCMMWIGFLTLIVLYAAGIFFTVVVGDEVYPEQHHFDSKFYFGTTIRSMLSLFNMILFAEWVQIIRPVFEHQVFVVPIFVMVTLLIAFGLMNVLVGVVVDSTMTAGHKETEREASMFRRRQMHAVRHLANVMVALDKDGDKSVSLEEMIDGGDNNEDFAESLRKLDLPKGFRIADLFQMLDQDASGHLSKKEFVQGLFRLTYSNDFQRLCIILHSVAEMKNMYSEEQASFREEMQRSFANLSKGIAEINSKLQTTHEIARPPGLVKAIPPTIKSTLLERAGNMAEDIVVASEWEALGTIDEIACRQLSRSLHPPSMQDKLFHPTKVAQPVDTCLINSSIVRCFTSSSDPALNKEHDEDMVAKPLYAHSQPLNELSMQMLHFERTQVEGDKPWQAQDVHSSPCPPVVEEDRDVFNAGLLVTPASAKPSSRITAIV